MRLKLGYLTVLSPYGKTLLVWRQVSGDARLIRIILPEEPSGPDRILRDDFPEAREGAPAVLSRLGDRIKAFLQGQPATFSLDLLDFSVCSSFQRRVLPAEHQVPWGRVTTYGWLARRIGVPGAARAVGSALSRNPFPLIVPCHRCIRENGQLGGFRGGVTMKRALLQSEGIVCDTNGRVPRHYFWSRGDDMRVTVSKV